jgi:hypothetical protein
MSTIALVERRRPRMFLWGFSLDARMIQKEQWVAAEHFSAPVSRYDASVAEVLKEIAEYQKLGADWDSEGALPISPEAVRLASWLVQSVAISAKKQGISWHPPIVGPSADGGINLEWEGDDRQVFLMIRPHQLQHVECVIEKSGARPTRQTISIWNAIEQSLEAISRE